MIISRFFSLSASHFLYSYYRDDKKWKESLTHFKKDAHLDFVLYRQLYQGIYHFFEFLP